MRSDDDRILDFINDGISKLAEENPDSPIDEIRDEIFKQLPTEVRSICPELSEEIDAGVKSIRISRAEDSARISKATLQENAIVFERAESLIACAELINRRLFDAFSTSDEVIKYVRSDDGSNMVQGNTLKLLMLLSMQGRICTLSSETITLLKSGFLEGTFARQRTMYETVVILAVIGRGGPEIAERYQAYAAFEHLTELNALDHPESILIHDYSESDRQETEEQVRWGIQKYGDSIKRPYEWAKPLLPEKKGRIHFSDLDELITNFSIKGIYLTGNYGIHSGPFATINNVKFDRRYPFNTGPERIENEAVRNIIHVMSILLAVSVDNASKAATALLACLREVVPLGILDELHEDLIREISAL